MPQKWQGKTPDWSAPATGAAAITPADADGTVYRALYVGGAGTVVVRLADDSADVSFVGVAAGTLLPICVKRVATASTATSIVGLR